jgi:hypothetical protein
MSTGYAVLGLGMIIAGWHIHLDHLEQDRPAAVHALEPRHALDVRIQQRFEPAAGGLDHRGRFVLREPALLGVASRFVVRSALLGLLDSLRFGELDSARLQMLDDLGHRRIAYVGGQAASSPRLDATKADSSSTGRTARSRAARTERGSRLHRRLRESSAWWR